MDVGRGRILVLGLDPTVDVLKTLADSMRWPVPVRPSPPNVIATLHYRGRSDYLVFAVNYSDESRLFSLTARVPEGKYEVRDITQSYRGRIRGNRVGITAMARAKGVEAFIVERLD